MDLFRILLIALCISVSAHGATEKEVIKQQMESVRFGERIRPVDLHGYYVGTCYDGDNVKTEGLFLEAFVNAAGVTTDLAISTAHTYGSYRPSGLEFLLSPSSASWDYMRTFVMNGLSGADNNLSIVASGPDFKYLYESALNDKTWTMIVGRDYGCTQGTVCNPPVLVGCRYGYNDKGLMEFSGCIRGHDVTVFKKSSENVLISHRTADGVGEPVNNLSFLLRPISSYCEWTRY